MHPHGIGALRLTTNRAGDPFRVKGARNGDDRVTNSRSRYPDDLVAAVRSTITPVAALPVEQPASSGTSG